MIIIKSAHEIDLMRQSALLVSKTLAALVPKIKPGVTPKQLDTLAEQFIRDNKAVPGFLGLYGCPSTLLISVNEAVVHGLPTDIPIKEGDILSIDCGVLMNNFYGDQAYTFMVGEVKPEIIKLLKITKESLYKGIEKCKTTNRIGDIGYAIQNYVEKHGYGVVRELVGHGLGKSMHEDPQVPNYGKQGKGKKIIDGMVIAIEPMINMGVKEVSQLKDGWTVVTADGKPSAHFEHDVAVINGKADILSTFDYIEDELDKIGMPSMRIDKSLYDL
jgi:methionyl aminopeptidase